MMDKDRIIFELTNLLLRILKIGQSELQEVTNLLCEIETLPKYKLDDLTLNHTNVISISDHRKLCPSCKVNNRKISASGKLSTYCTSCQSKRSKEKRMKKKCL
jgi:hypothetical protein